MTYIFSLKGRYASFSSDFRKTPETAREDKEICYSLKRERYAIVLRMSWNHICYATRRKMKVGKFVFSE